MTQSDSTQIDSLTRQTPERADLGTIYEPSAVEFTFETVGWAILGGVLMLILLILLFFLIKKHMHNRYRREGLAALQDIQSDQQSFSQVFVVLKRVAIHAFGREKVGNLHGASWLGFLDKTAKGVGFIKFEKQINALMYQDILPEVQTQKEIFSQAQKWIRTHAS